MKSKFNNKYILRSTALMTGILAMTITTIIGCNKDSEDESGHRSLPAL